MNQQIEQLKKWIEDSSNVVFFGGAGVVYGERDTGFPECGRALQPAVEVPA